MLGYMHSAKVEGPVVLVEVAAGSEVAVVCGDGVLWVESGEVLWLESMTEAVEAAPSLERR